MAFAIPLLVAGGEATSGLSTVLSVAGSALGAVGAVSKANYNRQVAMNNAQIAEQNAQQATYKAQQDAQNADLQAQAQLGAYISGAGASGLDVNFGSILGERQNLQELAKKDRGRIRTQGDASAVNYRQQGLDFQARAGQQKSLVSQSILGGAIDIGSSLITGASKVNKKKAANIRRNN